MFPNLAVWLKLLLAAVTACVISYLLTPYVKHFAEHVGAMDVPRDGRRVHDHPIPRMGGLAIFLGFVLSMLVFAEMSTQIMGMLIGAVLGSTLLAVLFAFEGWTNVGALAGEMKNPGRDLPRAMIGSTIIVAVIYAFIGIVAVGVLPVEQVAGESLVQVARAIFPAPLYIFFIVGGGMFAVASTLNATFTWTTKGLLIAAEEGWLPKQAAAISKRGTPWILLTVFYIVGLIPIVTGLSLETISRLGNGVSLIYVLMPIATGYLIHKKNPQAMANSPFKMSKPVLYVFTTVALIGYIMAIYFNLSDIQNAWQLILIYSAVVIVYAFLREKHVTSLSTVGK